MKSAFFILFNCAFSVGVFGVSVPNRNIQGTISEEDRRGALSQENKLNKEIPEKYTRGAYGASESKKQQSYFYPSGYDSVTSASGHGGGYGGSTGFSSSGGQHGSTGFSSSGNHHGASGFGSSGNHHGVTGYSSGSGHSEFGGGYPLSHGHSLSSQYGGGYGDSGFGGHSGYSGHGGGQIGGFGNHGALALKGLLIPLAGIALLGAAAALSTNPVLLQLGVVNGRRKRSTDQQNQVFPSNPYVKPDVLN